MLALPFQNVPTRCFDASGEHQMGLLSVNGTNHTTGDDLSACSGTTGAR